MRNAIVACAIITAAFAINLIVLKENHTDLMAIAKVPGACGGSDCGGDLLVAGPPDGLVTDYKHCSDAATTRVLSRVEAEDCADKYLRLKLSFLPDVTLQNYLDMTAARRAETNRRGYLYYLLWQRDDQKRGEYFLTPSGLDADPQGLPSELQ